MQINNIGDSVYSLCAAPNGDIYYAATSIIYKRTGGVGDFVSWFNVGREVQDMSVSLSGYLSISSTDNFSYEISQINIDTGITDPANTISQTHVVPERMAEPSPEWKPYENQTYAEMQTHAQPIKYTGRERQPAPEAPLPVLVAHIDEVFRYARSGSPIVIDIPTNEKDPIAGVEIYGRVDGFASVAPNGTSVIYNPGESGAALLTIHTKSGQQCTVNLMAK